VIENWVLWRDAGNWEALRHGVARRRLDDGHLVPGSGARLHPRQPRGFERGVNILHFLGGSPATSPGTARSRR
jgi:hypothetical protein